MRFGCGGSHDALLPYPEALRTSEPMFLRLWEMESPILVMRQTKPKGDIIPCQSSKPKHLLSLFLVSVIIYSNSYKRLTGSMSSFFRGFYASPLKDWTLSSSVSICSECVSDLV